MKRFIPIFTLFLFLISGCSTIKLGYNNAGWFLPWIVDDYFDLEPEQEKIVEERIAFHLEWHRYSELPKYSEFLKEMTLKIENGVSEDEYEWALSELLLVYRGLLNRLLPDATDFLLQLKPYQIKRMEMKLEEGNRKFAERMEKTKVEQRDDRALKIIEGIEDWVGNLNDIQRRNVRQLAATLPLDSDLQLQDRMRRQQDFLSLLREKPPKPEFSQRFFEWMTDFDKGRSAEYLEVSKEMSAATKKMSLEIANILTDGQKERAIQRLKTYQADFLELASAN